MRKCCSDLISIFSVTTLESDLWKYNILTDIGSAIYRINMLAGDKLNFVPCAAERQVLLTSAIVLRHLDYIDVCV